MAKGIFIAKELHLIDEKCANAPLLRASNICSYTIEEGHVFGAPSGNVLVVRMVDQSEHSLSLNGQQQRLAVESLLADIIHEANSSSY